MNNRPPRSLYTKTPTTVNLYTNYQASDFAQDESFQQWVLRPTSGTTAFWTRWVAEHPEKRAEVDEARRLILTLGQPEEPVEDWRATRMKRAILGRLSPVGRPAERQPRTRGRWAIAACLLALLVAGGGFWSYQQWAYVRYATDYGETQTFVLPDGSEVTLKANSSLRHPRRWAAAQDREVWLAGEAFFHVAKKMIRDGKGTDQRPATFVVHATEVVDVAVLGTEFNVSTRDEETEVVLKSGSVRVDVKHEAQPQTLLMEPGDRVAVVHRRGTLTQQQIDPQAPAAWRDNMLIFNEVTLAEVAKKLRHTYGVNIVFRDSTLAQRKFKGFVPADNLDVLLEAFAELYKLNIEQNDKQIIFSKKPNPQSQ